MTVQKLSQIAAAGSPPALTDNFVGVAGGTTDNLWSLSQFCRLRLTTATNYYITTAGNDSNPGTLASPWLTLQHANDWLATNVDFNNQTVTVNIGAGTFAGVSLTPMTGGGTLIYLGATWAPTTTLTQSVDGDCIDVFFEPLGSTAVIITQVILQPGSGGGYHCAVYYDCFLALGNVGQGGVVFGTTTNGAGIGIYAEGLCVITDNGGETRINIGVTQILSLMYLTGGAVYKKYGNWNFVNTPLAGSLLFVDTNSAFVNLDGDTFYSGGPTKPGGVPFHLRTGGVIELESSYFGDPAYSIVESGTFEWALGDPVRIPTDPATKSIQAPSTGFSIAFPESTYTLILNPTGTLATGTVTLPDKNYNSKKIVIKAMQQITALTITAPLTSGVLIASGTYNSGTGLVTLTLAVPLFEFYSIPGQSITISGVTGTGSFASVNGTFTAAAGTSGPALTVNYTIATGLTLTITSNTGSAFGIPDVFGSPGTISKGSQIEAEYDLTTNAWYIS